jgi:hypothetical protein
MMTKRAPLVLVAFMVGALLEYLWLGKDAFEAVGILLWPFISAPMLLLLMWADVKYTKNK